jgi:hypothetical protein
MLLSKPLLNVLVQDMFSYSIANAKLQHRLQNFFQRLLRWAENNSRILARNWLEYQIFPSTLK